jgi:hypothetical protein
MALPTPTPLAPGSLPDIEPPLGTLADQGPTSPFGAKLEGLRAKLPTFLQGAVKNVPTRVLFGAGAGLAIVIGVLAVVVSSLSGPSPRPGVTVVSAADSVESVPSVGKAALEGPFARPDELSEAKAKGPEGLEELLAKYPKDPNIPVEMARELASKKNYAGAVGAVGRALSIDAGFQNNAQVASLVFQTAQVKSSSDAAFALLEGVMGSRGADIAYDLVTTSNVRPWVQSRAETFLQSPAFDKVATPSLRAIVKLRYSAGCEEKRSLLGDLKKVSDERALFELVPLQDKTGCGARKKDDCYPCLRTSNDLDDAIAAVRTRKR